MQRWNQHFDNLLNKIASLAWPDFTTQTRKYDIPTWLSNQANVGAIANNLKKAKGLGGGRDLSAQETGKATLHIVLFNLGKRTTFAPQKRMANSVRQRIGSNQKSFCCERDGGSGSH